jgi:membrane carboxypeptidase/penicillin-binding protein PbpC
LVEKYGEDVVNQGGLKVVTTLDYDLQKKAEEIVKDNAFKNVANNASNMAMVGIDPRNRDLLFMVGSRDYFDTQIDGQYNVVTAERQPGSSFKPLVYALAFEKGYLPETSLLDIPMEFNASCSIDHVPSSPGVQCYAPENYTGTYNGVVSIRKALAGSLNIPAVEMLYLVGPQNAIEFAKNMGIETLKNSSRYGLSLVLGGAEVRLLDLANAYGVFASNGVYRKENPILSITDSTGKMLEESKSTEGEQVIKKDTALKMNSI